MTGCLSGRRSPTTGRKRHAITDLDLTTLRLERRGRVLLARVEAPPFNYMTSAMQRDLLALVRAVEDDDEVGAVVLTGGVDGRFITHFDISDLLKAARSAPSDLPVSLARVAIAGADRASALPGGAALIGRTRADGVRAITRFHDIVLGVMASPAVWIAAVNGPCGGGGLELIVHFDVRLSTPSAEFLLPELLIGLTTTVGSQRLAQLMGPSAALEFMLEGRAFSAEEAQRAGLISDVVAGGELIEVAVGRAARYASRNREVVAAQKALLNEAHTLTAAQSLRREGAAQMAAVSTATTRRALETWVEHQDQSGDSVFLTAPQPWIEGRAVNLNSREPGQ